MALFFICFFMFWIMKTTLTSDTFSAENNDSEFHAFASDIVLVENLTKNNSLKLQNLSSVLVSVENSFQKNSSVIKIPDTDLAENLVSSEIHTLTSDINTHLNENNTEYDDYMSGKNESLFECVLWVLEPDEFVIFPNGSAFVQIYNQIYEEPFYIFFDNLLRVCPPQNPADGDNDMLTKVPISYLAFIGVITSMVCLSIHLIVFSFVPDLQNLPGCNLSSLCASLFMSYFFMLLGPYQENDNHPNRCIVAGVLTYFFFMASFLWMFVIAFDVCRSIVLATGKLRVPRKEFNVKKFVKYNLFAWFTALVFTIVAVVADNLESIPNNFRPMFRKSCWFDNKTSLLTFFAVPVAVLICLNFIMFGISTFKTFNSRMKSRCESHQVHNLKKHLVYFRLSVVMGVTWITGVGAPVLNVLWLWYVFAVLNTLQGLFIFLAFTCSTNVINFIKKRIFKTRKESQQTLSPTFQSYGCNTGSVENDPNKIQDSKDASLSTDNTVIHL